MPYAPVDMEKRTTKRMQIHSVGTYPYGSLRKSVDLCIFGDEEATTSSERYKLRRRCSTSKNSENIPSRLMLARRKSGSCILVPPSGNSIRACAWHGNTDCQAVALPILLSHDRCYPLPRAFSSSPIPSNDEHRSTGNMTRVGRHERSGSRNLSRLTTVLLECA